MTFIKHGDTRPHVYTLNEVKLWFCLHRSHLHGLLYLLVGDEPCVHGSLISKVNATGWSAEIAMVIDEVKTQQGEQNICSSLNVDFSVSSNDPFHYN
jgi:hypothetical protein